MLIADIAMSIRMNSSYNSSSLSNPKTPHAVFVLSDSIHNLHTIGEALREGNSDKIIRAAKNQRDYWKDWELQIQSASLVNMDSSSLFDIEYGIEILDQLIATEKTRNQPAG